MFEYFQAIVGTGESEAILNEKGAQGWRLHSCLQQASIDGDLYLVLIMERFLTGAEDNKEAKGGAMAMRG